MPGWTHLSDAQIVAILNHAIGLGGPAVAPYEPDEVAGVRARSLRPADVLELRREVIAR
jgi:hypothetical protein